VGVGGAGRWWLGADELARHVHRVAADDEVVLGEVGDHRHVAGGVGEAD
jgi:hypothetical protein